MRIMEELTFGFHKGDGRILKNGWNPIQERCGEIEKSGNGWLN